ncbi:MAG: hypothetical protein CI952_45 [Methanohalophilus sp.]|jgi:hypothetical protein|nr:MAG: hypothetical protein CI952_45 [Methanohalophilus sp.]
MGRIAVISMVGNSGEYEDVAIIAQDDYGEFSVHGRDKVIKKSLERDVKKGINFKGHTWNKDNLIDGVLVKYNRPPQIQVRED